MTGMCVGMRAGMMGQGSVIPRLAGAEHRARTPDPTRATSGPEGEVTHTPALRHSRYQARGDEGRRSVPPVGTLPVLQPGRERPPSLDQLRRLAPPTGGRSRPGCLSGRRYPETAHAPVSHRAFAVASHRAFVAETGHGSSRQTDHRFPLTRRLHARHQGPDAR